MSAKINTLTLDNKTSTQGLYRKKNEMFGNNEKFSKDFSQKFLNKKIICIKIEQYMQNGVTRDFIAEPEHVNVALKKHNNKVILICGRVDLPYVLESKVFIYRNRNKVHILRRIGAPKCFSIKNSIVRIVVGSYAKKGLELFEKMREKLLLKQILLEHENLLY